MSEKSIMNIPTDNSGTLGIATLKLESRFRENENRNHVKRSFAKNNPTRNLYKQFCGTSEPDGFLIDAAKRFVAEVYDPLRNLSTKNPFIIKTRKSNVAPSRAKNGAGELWLRLFSEYQGDKCIVFPFRTVANPRGRVTFNKSKMGAYRAMCLMVNKLPPEPSMMALHRCGNGHLGCVTPRHLYWGDASDNVEDAQRHLKDGKPSCDPAPSPKL